MFIHLCLFPSTLSTFFFCHFGLLYWSCVFWRERREVACQPIASFFCAIFSHFVFSTYFLVTPSTFFLCIPPNQLSSFVRVSIGFQVNTQAHRHPTEGERNISHTHNSQRKEETQTQTQTWNNFVRHNKNKQLDRILKSTTLLFCRLFNWKWVNNPSGCRTLNHVHKSWTDTRKYNNNIKRQQQQHLSRSNSKLSAKIKTKMRR
jgi:hypothetical protein